jgi:hypothetical protein
MFNPPNPLLLSYRVHITFWHREQGSRGAGGVRKIKQLESWRISKNHTFFLLSTPATPATPAF